VPCELKENIFEMIYKGIEILGQIIDPKTDEWVPRLPNGMPQHLNGVLKWFVYVDPPRAEHLKEFETLDEAKAFVDRLIGTKGKESFVYKGTEIVCHHRANGLRWYVYDVGAQDLLPDDAKTSFDSQAEAKAFVDKLHLKDEPSLEEARAAEMIHHKASVAQLLALAKRQPMRFAIDEDDNLHFGSAHHFVHDELSDDPESHKIEGMMQKSQKTGKLHFHADDKVGHDPIPRHKVIASLEASGAIYKNRFGGSRDYRNVEF